MFSLIDKIDRAVETKAKCVLVHKMGPHYHGILTDSWVRISGGKMRGKVRMNTEEKGDIEVDGNDVLDLRIESDPKEIK